MHDHFRQIVESVKEVFWITSADASKLYYISPTYEEIWGRTCQSLFEQPQSWMEAVHPDDRAMVASGFEAAVTKGECRIEFRILRPDGAIRWIKDRAFQVPDDTGKIIRIAGIAEDITEWKKAEKELRTSLEHHRLICDLTSDYAYTSYIDATDNVVIDTFSEGFTRVTGYTLEELNSRGGWTVLIHPDDLPNAMEVNSKLTEHDRIVGELRIVTKSGEMKWIRYSSHIYSSVPGGPADRLVGAVTDITIRRQAQEQMRELSHRLIEVQEQERRHLARELHDEVGQLLTVLNLHLEAAQRPHAVDVGRSLEQARALVKELTAQVRDLSLQLRPTMLDDLGLVPALLWLFDRYKVRPGVTVEFEHYGLNRRLGPDVETAAYRIVQEALTNVARHSGVNSALVRAWLDDEKLHVTIEDNGRGFHANRDVARRTTAGLSGMQERAVLLGGELLVESIPQRGTHVAAHFPVSPHSPRNSP